MKVFCIETAKLPDKWVKATFALKDNFFSGISTNDIRWIERSIAEENILYKQIIPYIVLQKSSGQILCYPRHGTENRLHGLYSCGIGGHIEEEDTRASFEQTVTAGMLRELKEELTNFSEDKVELVYKGIINETKTKLGQLHLGLVYAAYCKTAYLPEAAEELAGMEWKTLEELKSIKKEFWSDLALTLI